MARFDGSLRRLALPALGLVELAGWMGRVGWVVPGTRMDPIQRVIATIEAGLPSMLHGLRAKESADALINSKNSMWPVAEFSRSHVRRPWPPARAIFIEMFARAHTSTRARA